MEAYDETDEEKRKKIKMPFVTVRYNYYKHQFLHQCIAMVMIVHDLPNYLQNYFLLLGISG